MIGWLKLHRAFIQWEWYDDLNVRVLFIHLLLTVNFEEKKWKGLLIKPGSRITGRIQLSKECGISEQNVRTAIKKLELTRDLTIEKTSVGTVFTVVNWDKYQSTNHETNQESTTYQPETNHASTTYQPETNHASTTYQPETNHASTTTKEVKKERTKEEEKEIIKNNSLLSEIKISDLEESEVEYFEIAKAFRDLFVKNLEEKNSPTRIQENAKYKDYVNPIRLMMTKDGVKKEQLTKVFKFLDSPDGNFWKPNILSTSKLREKFTQILLKSQTPNTNGRKQETRTNQEIATDAFNSETAKLFRFK